MPVWALLVYVFALTPQIWAQQTQLPFEEQPPRVLSSELAQTTEVLSGERLVDFVVTDTDRVVRVQIDGKDQQINPGRIITINKLYHFQRRQHRIRVKATDENGNVSRRIFIVRVVKPVSPLRGSFAQAAKQPTTSTTTSTKRKAALSSAEKKVRPPLEWFVSYAYRSDSDSNPRNDLSETVTFNNNVTISSDNIQEADRTATSLIVGLNQASTQLYLAVQQIEYDDEDLNIYNTGAGVFGFNRLWSFNNDKQLRVNYSFNHLNTGNQTSGTDDYALYQSVSFSGGSGQYLLGASGLGLELKLTLKEFADEDLDGVTNYDSKLAFRWGDQSQAVSLRTNILLGNSSEGSVASEYEYNGIAVDSRISGSRYILSFSYQQQKRSYQKADGDLEVREDTLTHIKGRLLLGLISGLNILLESTASNNDSNSRPYERNINSVGLQGGF